MSDKPFVGINWLRGAASECNDDGAPWTASWCFKSAADSLEKAIAERDSYASKLGKSENDKDALSTALTNVNRQLLDAQKEIQFLKDEGDEDSEWRDQVADESEAKIKELQSRLQASENDRVQCAVTLGKALADGNELRSRLEAAQKAIKERDEVCADAMRAHANTLSRLDGALALLRDVASSGVEFEDERVSYVTVQIDSDTMKQIRAVEKRVSNPKPCGRYWKFFGYQQGPCALHDGHEGSHNERAPE